MDEPSLGWNDFFEGKQPISRVLQRKQTKSAPCGSPQASFPKPRFTEKLERNPALHKWFACLNRWKQGKPLVVGDYNATRGKEWVYLFFGLPLG